MIPIPERRQVSAVPVDGGERAMGYYCFVGWTGNQKHYIIPEYASAFYGIEIDPGTIEPVKVRPIIVAEHARYTDYDCPNCHSGLDFVVSFPCCPFCGQTLDWHKQQDGPESPSCDI